MVEMKGEVARCFWADSEGEICPNPATHLEYDENFQIDRPTCNACCGSVRENFEPCKVKSLWTHDQIEVLRVLARNVDVEHKAPHYETCSSLSFLLMMICGSIWKFRGLGQGTESELREYQLAYNLYELLKQDEE